MRERKRERERERENEREGEKGRERERRGGKLARENGGFQKIIITTMRGNSKQSFRVLFSVNLKCKNEICFL